MANFDRVNGPMNMRVWKGRRFENINGNLSMEQFFQSAGLLSLWHVQEPKVQVKCINGITIIMYAQCSCFGVRVMVLNATFNNISVSLRSVLLVEESGVFGEK